MAGNHLLIGQGIGEASTFDPNYAIQQFGNVLAQKKAEQAKKDQDLINQASKLNPEAIRDADRQDYINKYNDWKQSQMNANQLPANSRQRLDQLANAQQKYNALNNFIYESKKEAANEHGVSNMLLQNPHMFSDEAHGQIIKSMQSPMSHSDFIPGNDYNRLERYVDHTKVDDGFDKANKELLKQQEWSNPIQSQGKDRQGNKTGVVVHNERQVEPEDLLATHAHMYTISPYIRASIDKRYADINGSTPQETMMLRLRQNAIDRGDLTVGANGQLQTAVNEKTKPEFKPNYAPDKFYEHQLWKLEHADGGQVAQPEAMKNITYAGGNRDFNMKNFVGVSLPSKNFGGAPAVDLATGQRVKALQPSDDYSVVAVGDAPIYNSDRNGAGNVVPSAFEQKAPGTYTHKRMVLVQQKPQFEGDTEHHYLVDYSDFPKNVANQKDVRTALSGLNKTPVYGQHSGSIKYNVDGQIYDIPSDKVNQFLKAKPKAKRID